MLDGFGRYNSTLKKQLPVVDQNPTEEKWQCKECGERNLMKSQECFVCLCPKEGKPTFAAKSTTTKRKLSSSSSSDSCSSVASAKKTKKCSRKKSISSDSSSECVIAEPAVVSANDNPDAEKAKAEALEQLQKINAVDSREERFKQWRALLRRWHPDKNLDRPEVATAVFRFLQKGKRLLKH